MEVRKDIWDKAYRDYCKANSNPLTRQKWQAAVEGNKTTKRKNYRSTKKINRIPNRDKRTAKERWLETHIEFLRWKKTEDYLKWRKKQFLKQGGTCYYCDEPLQGTKQNVDHVIPKIKGGDNRKSNLVLACWKCNKEKYTKTLNKKEKRELKNKNHKKKGTYLLTKELYKTEDDLAQELKQMFREE